MGLKRGGLHSGSFKLISKRKTKKISPYQSTSFLNNKKGQVTVFIIVGIALLFTFAGILYLTKTIKGGSLITEEEFTVQEVPQVFRPVFLFTEDCLTETAEIGLRVLGQQGGYIYPDLVGEYSENKPTDEDGLTLGAIKVPYWNYNSIPNVEDKISFSSLRPKLHYEEDPEMSIEAQLGRYIKENIVECLGNYQTLEEQGFNITMGDVEEVKADIGDGTILFRMNVRVESVLGEATNTLNQFQARIPLDLKKYYEAASDILLAEKNFTFIERQAQELIQVYSAKDVEKLPPTRDSGTELVPTASWVTADIRSKVRELLNSYVPMLRLASANNFYRYEYPVADLSALFQSNYDNSILIISNAENLDVNFDYLNWDFFMTLNGGANIIKPNHLAVHRSPLHFGVQDYYTVYDISYPVLITINDPNAFDGEGYRFAFALESNIRDNNPASEIDYGAATKTAEKASETANEIVRRARSVICDENQRDVLLKTTIVDSYTQEPISFANIGLKIQNQDDCIIGTTQKNGKLEEKSPAVYGGILTVMKEDYLTNFYPIDTYKYKDSSAIIGYAVADVQEPVIELHRYKDINVTIKKKLLKKCIGNNCFSGSSLFPSRGKKVYSYIPEMLEVEHSWHMTDITSDLNDSEEGLITLKRIGDLHKDVNGEEFATALSTKGNESKEISLVPGIYEVGGTIISKKEIIIPEEERCDFPVCFTMNEVKLGSMVLGQLAFDTKESYLVIEPEDLYSSREIIFYIPSADFNSIPAGPHMRVLEDMQLMGELGKISQSPGVRLGLEPEFR